VKPWELILAALLYTSVATRYGLSGNSGMALAWGAYAVANLGFIWAAVQS
jgi:uncharacterized membrane protein YecN with MAPEG domain